MTPETLETIRRLPAIEQGLAVGRPWLVYDALRQFLPLLVAGDVLLELTRTTDGWEDRVSHVMEAIPGATKGEDWEQLDEGERTVLFMLGEGLSRATIADVLEVSRYDIRRVGGRLRRYFGVQTDEEVVREARLRGLLQDRSATPV